MTFDRTTLGMRLYSTDRRFSREGEGERVCVTQVVWKVGKEGGGKYRPLDPCQLHDQYAAQVIEKLLTFQSCKLHGWHRCRKGGG